MQKRKKFRDPIHDFIQVSQEELEIINSPVFQRTHNIRQLSLGYYVYHGAEHSRFGHMIGASHIAGLAYDSDNPRIRDAALIGIEAMDDPTVIKILQDALRKEQHMQIKQNLQRIIKQLQDVK